MFYDNGVIYQSALAAEMIFLACDYAPINLENIQFVSNEMAQVNLELAILYYYSFSDEWLS